jgi:hypothetical protein
MRFSKVWIARLLIGIVLLWNVQCAVAFLVTPGAYAGGFELSGASGEGMIRGMGILFLMWNVPYAVALLDPLRHRISLIEAVIMQAIGFAGETLLLLAFPDGHPAVHASLVRFIAFDGAGLLALLIALLLIRKLTSGEAEPRADRN